LQDVLFTSGLDYLFTTWVPMAESVLGSGFYIFVKDEGWLGRSTWQRRRWRASLVEVALPAGKTTVLRFCTAPTADETNDQEDIVCASVKGFNDAQFESQGTWLGWALDDSLPENQTAMEGGVDGGIELKGADFRDWQRSQKFHTTVPQRTRK
jgi:hypothetical protein